ncbi:MAG: hypothetical protein ACE5QV_06210, partial [Fidelibacterota bacterium]
MNKRIMKFLICIGGEEFSKQTITFGGNMAEALNADISVLYVGTPPPRSVRNEMQLSREKLSEWEIDHPGVKVLRYARDVLMGMKIVKVLETGEIVQRHSLKPDIKGAYELHIYGIKGEDIRLRLREGDIVHEIKKEVEVGKYDVAFLGASKDRRLIHKIVQFVDCTLFIVKNIRDIKYKLLFCVDDSQGAKKAVEVGSRLAKFFDAEVVALSVAETDDKKDVVKDWLTFTSKLLKRAGIRFNPKVTVGDV